MLDNSQTFLTLHYSDQLKPHILLPDNKQDVFVGIVGQVVIDNLHFLASLHTSFFTVYEQLLLFHSTSEMKFRSTSCVLLNLRFIIEMIQKFNYTQFIAYKISFQKIYEHIYSDFSNLEPQNGTYWSTNFQSVKYKRPKPAAPPNPMAEETLEEKKLFSISIMIMIRLWINKFVMQCCLAHQYKLFDCCIAFF